MAFQVDLEEIRSRFSTPQRKVSWTFESKRVPGARLGLLAADDGDVGPSHLVLETEGEIYIAEATIANWSDMAHLYDEVAGLVTRKGTNE